MIYPVGDDPDTQMLEVVFNSGGIYQSYDVPPEGYEELMTAESKGSYMHACIIDVYPYAQIK